MRAPQAVPTHLPSSNPAISTNQLTMSNPNNFRPTTSSFHTPVTARPYPIPCLKPLCPATAALNKTSSTASGLVPADYNSIIGNSLNWLLCFALSFNTLLVVMSLLLNLIIITYYWSYSSNLSSTLYLRNGIADSISAIGFVIQVLLAL